MVSVDGSLFCQIVNFLLLVWVLNMLLYKPIRGIVSERHEIMSGLESEIELYSKAIIDKNRAYDDGLKKARLEGQNKKQNIIDAALGDEAEVIRKITDKAQVELNETKSKIKLEVEAAKASLEKDIDVFAKAIGHKILGRIV